MQLPVGNLITMINSDVTCPVQCLCVAQLGIKEDKMEHADNTFNLTDNHIPLV